MNYEKEKLPLGDKGNQVGAGNCGTRLDDVRAPYPLHAPASSRALMKLTTKVTRLGCWKEKTK